MIAILGGGIAGAFLARALAGLGRRDVDVYDPAPPGQGSTGRALGGFRTQHGNRLNAELALASREYFARRADRVDFRASGYLYLATSGAAADALEERARCQREWGLPIEHPAVADRVPYARDDDVVATNFCGLDGLYLPPRVLGCVIEEARSSGARFHYGSPAPGEDLARAEAVVVCAGSRSAEVGRALGVELNVRAQTRGVFQVGPFPWVTGRGPMLLEVESGFHFRERDGRLLVMAPYDPDDWASHRSHLVHRVPGAAGQERPEGHWTGEYEVTFDHHPLVGPTGREKVWAMCGFSGHGVMQSPAVAASLAAMMVGATPQIDITALDPRRAAPLVDATQL
ncbi:MAG: FAD-binding oxidoreductase [Candidatus Dormibacteraeota bacterium]|nr:FAD-binding oxidoreductase [Candidatus Dormibacteraeota bacterium]